MSIIEIYHDIQNTSGKKVLDKLTIDKREKISTFLWRRTHFTVSFFTGPNQKSVSFFLQGDRHASSNKLFKSLRSALRYFLSREKTGNTGEFNFDLHFLNTDDTIPIILENVSSEAFLTKERNKLLKLFSFYLLNEEMIYFIIFFNNGNFLEEEPSAMINEGKTFTMEEKCVICLENTPELLFWDCGHICVCVECFEVNESPKCRICKTVNRAVKLVETLET